MQASLDPPPATAEAAAAPTPGKPEKASMVKAPGRPSTLLDVQEVEWITRELERLLALEQGVGGDAGADGRHHHRRKRAKLNPAPKKGGFLADLLGKHAVSICSGDTVEASATAGGDRGRRRGGGGFLEVEEKV
ncbi:hypothetical protein BS78_04G270100 [Paspalum vaginatum]|nr:hypothetical protein BS78_04G270100 [Paspalum vaginatum]